MADNPGWLVQWTEQPNLPYLNHDCICGRRMVDANEAPLIAWADAGVKI